MLQKIQWSKRKRTRRKIMILVTQHRKLKIEQQELH
jgi:hypothetical protein